MHDHQAVVHEVQAFFITGSTGFTLSASPVAFRKSAITLNMSAASHRDL